MSGVSVLLSDSRGVYIPRDFANIIRSCQGSNSWNNYHESDIEILEEGPETDNEWYWETWDSVLYNITFTDSKGHVWRLYHDGDLFLYCEELMTDEEYDHVFQCERVMS